MQYHWWKATLKFWNDAVGNQNSPLLKLVLASDAKLALEGCKNNWTTEVRSALVSLDMRGLGPTSDLAPLPISQV